MVMDSKINADDTGRLVSGTDANGNTIPPDTFVGAVSDTGPIALASQRQHHHGVEQLRQAVDRYLPAAQRQRPAGHPAERLQRQRDAERRGSDVHRRQHHLPERQRGGHDQRVRHRRPALRPDRLHARAAATPAPC